MAAASGAATPPSAATTIGSDSAVSFTDCGPATRSRQPISASDRRNRQYGRLPPASADASCSGVSFGMARS